MRANMQYNPAAKRAMYKLMDADAHRDAKVGLSSTQAAVYPGRRSHWELQPAIQHKQVDGCHSWCQMMSECQLTPSDRILQVTSSTRRSGSQGVADLNRVLRCSLSSGTVPSTWPSSPAF